MFGTGVMAKKKKKAARASQKSLDNVAGLHCLDQKDGKLQGFGSQARWKMCRKSSALDASWCILVHLDAL